MAWFKTGFFIAEVEQTSARLCKSRHQFQSETADIVQARLEFLAEKSFAVTSSTKNLAELQIYHLAESFFLLLSCLCRSHFPGFVVAIPR